MGTMKTKFCPAMWLSGFFGLGALIHLIRLVMGFSVVIAGHEIPKTASGLAVLIFGTLSVGLFTISLKRPCESGESGSSTCCK